MAGRQGVRRQVAGVRLGLALIVLLGLFAAPPTVSKGIAGAASPKPSPPTVTALSAAPSLLSSSGGAVALSAQVTGATSCVFSATTTLSGLPATVPCTSGAVSESVRLPADSTSKPVNYTFDLAVSGSKTVNAKTVKVTVAATAPPTVTGFSSTPLSLSSSGGPVVLSAQVTGATSCVFSATTTVPGLPATVPCTSGAVTENVSLPADTSTTAQSYSFGLSVIGSKTVKAKAVKATVAAKPGVPTVTKLSPTSGSQVGGTTVTITGTNLTGVTAVQFGNIPATHVTFVSATSVTATSPVTAIPGPVAVTVTNPGGTSALSSHDTFTYTTAPLPPAVTGISPASGPQAGGTLVTIIGSNLTGATSVNFGTIAGTITSDTATSITATSPAETPDTVNITVTTANGTSATSLGDQFTFATPWTPCSGPLTADEEITPGAYQVDCTFDVPAGLTLVIEAGAILKFGSGDSITVHGTLNAIGTATDPISFTSLNDNSIGGSTGTGSPAPGDWAGISLFTSGSLDLEDSVVEYAGTGVDANTTGSVVIKNDTFSSTVGSGVYLQPAGDPTVENNTAYNTGAQPSAPAFFANGGLNPNLLSGNSASGGWPLFVIGGQVDTSGTLPAESIPWSVESSLTSELDVPEGVTLTVAPGAVFKNFGPNFPYSITVHGTLNAIGTATDPISFTSLNDNSIGGSTGTGSPAPGDWAGISLFTSGSLDLEDSVVEYAGTGVDANTTGSVVIKNDTFSSTVGSGVYLQPAGDPTVENNTAYNTGAQPSAPAFFANGGLNPNLLSGNSASGGWPLFVIGGQVDTSGTLPAESIPWSVESSLTSELDVPEGVTLTVAPGAVFKNFGPNFPYSITVHGTLNAIGTATDPISFTSLNDNSIGGSTGTGSPAPGDWAGISLFTSGSLDLEDSVVEYAGTGVDANTTGSVVIKNDTFSSTVGSGVYLQPAGDPTVENNTALDDGSSPNTAAYLVAGGFNPSLLGGNSATGGYPYFNLAGTDMTNGTLSANDPTWLIGYGEIDVPYGVILNIAEGAVIKSDVANGPAIFVGGTLESGVVMTGSDTEETTFTSINDNDVGGASGSGTPAAGDWGGISASTTASIDLEHTDIDYASTGVDVAVGTSEFAKFNYDDFKFNGTGISMSAAVEATPSIENSAFAGNQVAINATSNWTTATILSFSCGYQPQIIATNNTFDGFYAPRVSDADYLMITGLTEDGVDTGDDGLPVETYPDGWTSNLRHGDSDTIAWQLQPCVNALDLGDSYVAIAIPLTSAG